MTRTEIFGIRHETLRLIVALYVILTAIGVFAYPEAEALGRAVLPEPYARYAMRVVLFAVAYLVLIGAWLRAAVLVLIAYVALARIAAGYLVASELLAHPVLHDTALVVALALVGGLSLPCRKPETATFGRVRLARQPPQRRRRRPCQAPDGGASHALFDQIVEA